MSKQKLKDVVADISSEVNYILSKYIYFDKENFLLIYEDQRMNQLCPDKDRTGAYYVTPFLRIKEDEYIYTTVSKNFEPLETCGIRLNTFENEQIIKLELSLSNPQ